MTSWSSTMRAPLTADEENSILVAWWALERLLDAQAEVAEPLEMLNHVTDVQMACYEVRRAIHSAWDMANTRAFPNPTAKPRRVTRDDLTALFGDPE